MRARVGWIVAFFSVSTAAYAWNWKSDRHEGFSRIDSAAMRPQAHTGAACSKGLRGHPVYFNSINVCEAGPSTRVANVASGPWASAVVAATFEGTAHVGRFTLPSRGGTDVLLALYDAWGRVVWARSFGDEQRQRVADVATDNAGNIYLLGDFSGVLDFGRGVLLHPEESGVGFLAKFDARGEPLWALQLGSGGPVFSAKLAVNPQGRIAATGSFQGRIEVLGFPVSGDGVFLAEIDADRQPRWVASFHGSDDWIQAVAFDGGQNAALWLGHAHADRTFIRRLDPFGNLLLDRRYMGKIIGDFVEDPQGMVADSAGNMFLVGQGYLDNAGNIADGGFFLAKLEPTGDVAWIDRFSDREFKRLALTAWGQLRTAGLGPFKPDQMARPLLIATYDPWGRLLWTRQFRDVESVDGFDLDPVGATLVSGTLYVDRSSPMSPSSVPSVATSEEQDEDSSIAPAERPGGLPCQGPGSLRLYVTKLLP